MKEGILHHTYQGNYKRIVIGDVPQAHMPTSDELYDNGRRVEGGKEALEEASFYHRDITEDLGLYVLPKRNPYIAEPALDNMVYLAKEASAVKSIDQLSPKELRDVFATLFSLQSAYEYLTPLQAHVISTSFHANPLYDQSVFGKKVHAQSLPDLHFHAFSFSVDEVSGIKTIPKHTLKKPFQDYMNDPFNTVVQGLAQEQGLSEKLIDNTSSFHGVNRGPMEGIRLTFDPSATDDEQFYSDLQRVHSNLNDMYTEIAGLFVDSSAVDKKQMPMRLSPEESASNVLKYIDKYTIASEANKRRLHFLAAKLKAGEEISSSDERVFLRGCAYTLFMANRAGEEHRDLYFAPKIVSTGNALSGLGLFYQKAPIVDDKWLGLRDQRQTRIAEMLKAS